MQTHTQTRRARLWLERLEDRLVFDVAIAIHATLGRHAIDSNIYGTAYAGTTALADLNAPMDRWGGNLTSRYNWQQNADNHAADWYFESIGYDSATPGAEADAFIAAARAAGAQASITIPTLNWVANLGPNRGKLASFSVQKYGSQQSTDYWMPDAGNGVRANGSLITGNNPADANVPSDVNFQRAWVQHLIDRWGNSTSGGLRYYALDNEPSLWHETHRDVHPTGATMEEIRDKFLAFASMIKSLDPGAIVLGPEEWGWAGYLYSGYDQQYASAHGWSSFPDRAAHGNMDYLPWLLDQIHQHDVRTGQRLMDYFNVHYYPQGGEFSDDVSRSMQLLRNRSTRSLWDPNYLDPTWINDRVRLVPRLHEWVDTYYPGTKIGITEYNWGAEGHMNGATTQADILGIFGREGLDLANRWTTPAAGTPTYLAMKMYRNYDGQHSTFGDTSVRTVVPNPDEVSAFSAIRGSDGALTIMVVNKNLYDSANPNATTTITLNLADFQHAGLAQIWRLAASSVGNLNQASIRRLTDVTFSGNTLTITLPMQSVTLFVLRAGQPQPPGIPTGVTATAGNAQVRLAWTAVPGATSYSIYRGTTPGGQGGTPLVTGVTATSYTDTAVSNGTTYYYRIQAVNAAGPSGLSAEVSGRPQAAAAGRAINSGGSATGAYLADGGFSGGSVGSTTRAISVTGVSNAAPQAVYQRWRYGSFKYTLGNFTPAATYVVRLHFAETVATRSGQRWFDVYSNGVRVLRNFDIFASAGGQNRAVVREIVATATSAGQLTLQFVGVRASAWINGIEVLPRLVRRIDAGGASDTGYSGGTASSTTATIDTSPVSDPLPGALYQSERYGTFTYTLGQLTPGERYTVRLDFAEIYWNAAGRRLFDVKINSTTVLSRFDVWATAGGKNRAVRREFQATADSQGRLVLEFQSVVNFATVAGITVF